MSLPLDSIASSFTPVRHGRASWIWRVLAILALAGPIVRADEPSAQRPNTTASADAEYADFYAGKDGTLMRGSDWLQAISVTAPPVGSDIKGDTTVTFTAPGMSSSEVLCWQQPSDPNQEPYGHDAVVAKPSLDAAGAGSFVFHADQFPNGPITLRIQTKGGGKQDLYELQLFNQGGVVWNQGIPKTDPPAAKGMTLSFSDDFNRPLSISGTGAGATYEAHKTGGGDFSGWRFTSPGGPLDPFSQVGTWLRIRASKPAGTKGSSGILSSAHEDGTGFLAKAPCYFECRLMAQSAPGTWPAFWLLTQRDKTQKKAPVDELDIIEAYGGMGARNPNFIGYACTSHFWSQPKPAWQLEKGADGKSLHPAHKDVPMMSLGGKSTWSTTFHTYGCLITPTETAYYLDDIEVLRHPTNGPSATEPLFFMINYAIGGISGWHIDLDRYGNQTDMWVDYVRVYSGAGNAAVN